MGGSHHPPKKMGRLDPEDKIINGTVGRIWSRNHHMKSWNKVHKATKKNWKSGIEQLQTIAFSIAGPLSLSRSSSRTLPQGFELSKGRKSLGQDSPRSNAIRSVEADCLVPTRIVKNGINKGGICFFYDAIYIIQVHLENNEFSDLKAPSTATRGMNISPRHILKVLRLQSSLDDDNGSTRGQWYLYCRGVAGPHTAVDTFLIRMRHFFQICRHHRFWRSFGRKSSQGFAFFRFRPKPMDLQGQLRPGCHWQRWSRPVTVEPLVRQDIFVAS